MILHVLKSVIKTQIFCFVICNSRDQKVIGIHIDITWCSYYDRSIRSNGVVESLLSKNFMILFCNIKCKQCVEFSWWMTPIHTKLYSKWLFNNYDTSGKYSLWTVCKYRSNNLKKDSNASASLWPHVYKIWFHQQAYPFRSWRISLWYQLTNLLRCNRFVFFLMESMMLQTNYGVKE